MEDRVHFGSEGIANSSHFAFPANECPISVVGQSKKSYAFVPRRRKRKQNGPFLLRSANEAAESKSAHIARGAS